MTTAERDRIARPVVVFYGLMVVAGLIAYTALSIGHSAPSLWVGTILGTSVGFITALQRFRWWVAVSIFIAVAMVGSPLMPPEIAGSHLWKAFIPAAICAYASLSDRWALVAFWFPTVIWMLSILDRGRGHATPDDVGLAMLALLAALFVAFLRVRESRRIQLWRTVSTRPLAAATKSAMLEEAPGRPLLRAGWGLAITAIAFAFTGWVAPKLWGLESFTDTKLGNRGHGRPCCPTKPPEIETRSRIGEYFDDGRTDVTARRDIELKDCVVCPPDGGPNGDDGGIDDPWAAIGDLTGPWVVGTGVYGGHGGRGYGGGGGAGGAGGAGGGYVGDGVGGPGSPGDRSTAPGPDVAADPWPSPNPNPSPNPYADPNPNPNPTQNPNPNPDPKPNPNPSPNPNPNPNPNPFDHDTTRDPSIAAATIAPPAPIDPAPPTVAPPASPPPVTPPQPEPTVTMPSDPSVATNDPMTTELPVLAEHRDVPSSSRPAPDTLDKRDSSFASWLHWLTLLVVGALAYQGVGLAMRPLRRAITLRHLRRPFWDETIDQRISNAWQLALVGLRDAGWRAVATESPSELAKRVDVAGLDRCATILDRARYGIEVDANDVAEMAETADNVYHAARKPLGPFARIAALLRRPLA